jgi:protein-S-isoprenylcysteine O-methyltransferase Ste14
LDIVNTIEAKDDGGIAARPPEVARLGAYQHWRRVVLAVLIAALFSILLFGQFRFPAETVVHETLEMLGIAMIFLGIVGRLWSTLYIGGRKSAVVVTGGPYFVTRQPALRLLDAGGHGRRRADRILSGHAVVRRALRRCLPGGHQA